MEQQKSNISLATVVNETDVRMKNIAAYQHMPITATAQKVGFAAVVVGGVFVASALAFHIITGVLAIAAVGAGAVGMWGGWHWVKSKAPAFQQRMKNETIKRMMAEAKRDAVSQLDNYVIARREKLLTSREARNNMGNVIQTMKTKISKLEEGSDSRNEMNALLHRIEEAYVTVCAAVDTAAESNKVLEKKVQEYKDKDEIAKLAGDAMAIFENTTDAKVQEMLSLESFKSIDSEFNTAIISIENSARDMKIDNA